MGYQGWYTHRKRETEKVIATITLTGPSMFCGDDLANARTKVEVRNLESGKSSEILWFKDFEENAGGFLADFFSPLWDSGIKLNYDDREQPENSGKPGERVIVLKLITP